MVHPLVTQLWFARSEFVRGLKGVTSKEAGQHLGQMNCLSWIVGHLASQEQYLWLESAQGKTVAADLHAAVGYGSPASAPPWDEMWRLWREITGAADDYLTSITEETIGLYLQDGDDIFPEDVGTTILRNMYHYWFHLGEAHAIRQMLGHKNIPQYVGNLSEVKY